MTFYKRRIKLNLVKGIIQIFSTRIQRFALWPLEKLSETEAITQEDAREVILYSESGKNTFVTSLRELFSILLFFLQKSCSWWGSDT